MSDITCPICQSNQFAPHGALKHPRCKTCGSLPRNRSAFLLLMEVLKPAKGMKIAHFAPEKGIAKRLHAILQGGYERYDLNPQNYDVPGLPAVRKIDLCSGLSALKPGTYDAVLHNHVMEHLPCNETIVLQRLHALLRPGGIHIFLMPMTHGYSRADLNPEMTGEERTKTFFQHDHIRKFGRTDFDMTLGMVFDLTTANYTLRDFLSERQLVSAAIPAITWTPIGSTVFLVRKAA